MQLKAENNDHAHAAFAHCLTHKQIRHLSLEISEETWRQASYQDMVRSEALVQNSAPVDVSQGLQDSLPMLHQGGEGRPAVPVAHTPSLAPYLLPVTTRQCQYLPS